MNITNPLDVIGGFGSTGLRASDQPTGVHRRPRRPTRPRRRAALIALAAWTATTATADAFEHLLTTMPPGANTLVMVQVHRLFETPMAIRQGWKEADEYSTANRPITVPLGAQRAVLASRLDMETMETTWQAAAMELDHLPDMAEVATRRHGQVDTLAGQPAARLPHDIFAIHLQQNVVGVMFPADRQRAVAFVRDARSGNAGPRGYLANAARLFDDRTTMLVAIDLENVAAASEVHPFITAWIGEHGDDADADVVANLLLGIRGITLKLLVDEHAMVAIGVYFKADAVVIRDFAIDLIRDLLANVGADLDDMSDWKVAIKGSTVTLGGALTESGLRRLLTLVEMPAVGPGPRTPTPPVKIVADGAPKGNAKISLRYFHGITTLLNDLQGGQPNRDMSGIAVWVARYADKIENLRAEGVDPDLLQYGAEVATALHEIATVVQGAGDGVAAHTTRQRVPRQIATSDFYVKRPDEGRQSGQEYWQQYHARRRRTEPMGIANSEIQRQRRAVASEQVAYAQTVAAQINLGTEQVRKQMTERYGKAF